MTYLELNNVFKIFGKNARDAHQSLSAGKSKDEILIEMGNTVALADVSLYIKKGETFVVMGLSGSGKSTLIRCLNRLIEPTSGKILFEGEDILKFSKEQLMDLRRHKMSMVFQRFGLFPHRTVVENVAYGLEIQGVEKAERNQKALEWIETVGLKGWEYSKPDELSGGMQQRVGLARALCTDPEILLMDEAFSALDPLIRREMQDELIELQSKLHKTIIFITHDLDEALRLGDTIAILKDGKVVQIDTPEGILMNPADSYVKEFTQDVNRLKVLTAENAMYKPITVVDSRGGPRVAINAMEKQLLSSVYVVDKDRKLLGMVTINDAMEAVEKHATSLKDIIIADIPRADPEDTLEELLPKATSSQFPIAVVNRHGRLMGVLPRVAVLSALSREEEGGTSYGRDDLAGEMTRESTLQSNN
ncbi:MAG: glycine betaine/L-proline ABC transporter ATP-binding protein [Anaerolineaceae bacterium]|nr:glycine betaine/L-proline ABC transporter ATP-binding protein [Anaerolineaceae bacterium]